MKIDISGLFRANGEKMSIELEDAIVGLDEMINDIKFDETVNIRGELTNVNGIISLSGVVSINFMYKCCKCLAEAESQLELNINEKFIRDPFVAKTSNNSDKFDKSDQEFYAYNGFLLDLDKVIVDNIILEIPSRQMCREDCKGLCPHCGADLNNTTCECNCI